MNSWPWIKGRLQQAILTTTKGRWALARGQVLHMVTWGQAVQMGPAEALSPSTPTAAHAREQIWGLGRLWNRTS
ncbi:hypothetical protein ATANTOWER_020954 [Ataeniobius toweri]|uniref:Uncharacterized protein n=1 Tax=Ataeniobius toweri TaxID=208326 RepID=A0ABU7BAI7_9TELE|nr:hypothetical protein [Ataeniobius toweri]